MTVFDLDLEQLQELKQNYLCNLADRGEFAEIVGRDYDAPSYDDLALAGAIVPDPVIFREYEGVEFSDGDFVCSMPF